MIQKLKNFFNSYVEVNDERKRKKWIEVYLDIVDKLSKEDEEKFSDTFEHYYDIYTYSKKILISRFVYFLLS